MSYDKLIGISELDFRDKSILLIGGGWMAGQYHKALKALGVEDISVITNTEETAVMLALELEDYIELVTLESAACFTKLAEEIFGYSSVN